MNRRMLRLLSTGPGAAFEIRILMRQTAKAFEMKVPAKDPQGEKTAGGKASGLLRRYAVFTAEAADGAAKSGTDLTALHEKLYQSTYRLGSFLRKLLRPVNEKECFQILAVLYSNIDISISEGKTFEFFVSHCYFSSFYTPEICELISGIDQGIFAGIYHGGMLTFDERITEGCCHCRARLLSENPDQKNDRKKQPDHEKGEIR